MTLIPQYKWCPKCKKMYSWNPDVGNMWCPRCGPSVSTWIGNILSGKKKRK